MAALLRLTRLMVPPEMFTTTAVVATPVVTNSPKLELAEVLPTTMLLSVPPLSVKMMAKPPLLNRPATFTVPPSWVYTAPEPNVIELPMPVPTLKVPAEMRSEPFTVAEPVWPVTVKLGLLSQKPPVAGIK